METRTRAKKESLLDFHSSDAQKHGMMMQLFANMLASMTLQGDNTLAYTGMYWQYMAVHLAKNNVV